MNSIHNSVRNSVTHDVRNAARRNVQNQNQNQNQSSSTASWGVPIKACIRRPDRSEPTAASMHALREIGGGCR